MTKEFPIKFDIDSHKSILSLIHKRKKISAAELSRISGLQKSSLLYILRALESRSLIRVHTQSYKTEERGRPSTLYELNGDIYNILGIELFPGTVHIVLTGFSGEVIRSRSLEYNLDINNLSDLYSNVTLVLNDWDTSFEAILGIGVVLPGMIDPESGTVISSKPLNLPRFPLEMELQKYFPIPVKTCNDAKAGAMGAFLFSQNRNIEWNDILYFSVNLGFGGIGTGFILDGRPYYGSSGHSGEIYMSLPSILPNGLDSTLCTKISKQLAKVIVNQSQLLNPDYIEIGGDIALYPELFTDYLVPRIVKLQKRQYPKHYQPPLFGISPFGVYANAVGGAALILQEVLK